MPTNHRRVSVLIDDSLAEALERARDSAEAGVPRIPDARLIHDLAIDGAQRLVRSSSERARLLAELADPEVTTARIDLDALREMLARRETSPLELLDYFGT